MATQNEQDAAEAFMRDCEEPYGKRIAQELVPQLQEFLSKHRNRPIVVVTSGGTTVPLEKRCVRFIDNFSAGHRGALSTEQFLEAGYAVVHLHRDSAVEPFTPGLPASSLLALLKAAFVLQGSGPLPGPDPAQSSPRANCDGAPGAGAAPYAVRSTKALQGHLRDVCACDGEGRGGGPQSRLQGGVGVRPEVQCQIEGCLRRAARADAEQALLMVAFQNLFEYLQSLRCVALALQPLGPRALFYLAAAVSDFYIPWSELAEHKIQSSEGPLQLTLQKVPKLLGLLTNTWVPHSMVVSFKLETDPDMLIRKAAAALRTYRVHAVVANLLHTRKDRVLLVTQPQHAPMPAPQANSSHDKQARQPHAGTSSSTQPGSLGFTTHVRDQQERAEAAAADQQDSSPAGLGVNTVVIDRAADELYIERQLVAHVVAKHMSFMARQHPQPSQQQQHLK